MADSNLSNSCSQRDFLIAWRKGKTCCPFCSRTGNPSLATFSHDGLHHHYRMVHKQLEFNNEMISEGMKILRGFAASETLENLFTLSEKRKQLGSDSLYKVFTVKAADNGVRVELVCSSDKEAVKFYGLYLDHKDSLPKLGDSSEGREVNVWNNLMNCTYKLWRTKEKIYAEAIHYKTKMPVGILPAPVVHPNQAKPILTNLPVNEVERENFVLKMLYGYDTFREGQLNAIQSILQGKDTLVLIPTGGGKSVIYTVAAVVKQGLTVVIEPLKFIMEEQAQKLRGKQVPAFFYNSSLTDTEMDFVVNTLSRLDLPYALLFTSPECIVGNKLINLLTKWSDAGKLNFIAVDEAHCTDVWGQAFRTDFLKLGILKDFNVPIAALTGTGTNRVQTKITTTLKMEEPIVIQITSSRTNLHLQIIAKKDKPKSQIAEYILQNCQGQRGIIYCARRKETVDLAHELKLANISAVFVHGALTDIERKKHEHAWASGLVQVICATKAFGMGIDQKDVRFVLHMSFPESIEDYSQEIGRAGRDGLPALCTLFFKHEDRSFHLHHIVLIEDKEYMAYKYDLMNKMMEYCESGICRHKFLLAYFEEVAPVCEEHCDVCTSNVAYTTQDVTNIAQLIVKGLITVQDL